MKKIILYVIIVTTILIVAGVTVFALNNSRKNSQEEKPKENNTSEDNLDNNEDEEPATAESDSQEELKDFTITGTYTFENTDTSMSTATATASDVTTITVTVDENNNLSGTYLVIGHFESTLIPDIVDTSKTVNFGGIAEQYSFNQSVTLAFVSDNNVAIPYHKEETQTGTVKIMFTENVATMELTINWSNGPVTDTFELTKI